MTSNPQIQDTKRDMTRCALCGTDSAPLVAKDFHFARRPGNAWVLAAICRDSYSCSQRRLARDRHLDERYELTQAGRQALEMVEQAEQLRMGA